jgi:Lon protease-like protein
MAEQLPLFPLGTVLFPGLLLPLHIFEDRYRRLVRDLLELPEPRRFGIVAIELGHEVGAGAARRLATVGCVAELRVVTPHEDGRYDLVTVGGSRFDVEDVDDSLPYLRASVEFRSDDPAPDAGTVAHRVAGLFHAYRAQLAGVGAESVAEVELPDDPVQLSYLVAAATVLDRDEKQALLEAADATVRLEMEERFLARENRLLDALPTVPASPFIDGAVNPN